MQIDLRGRRVIVTGASRGIGEAIATAFAKEECKVAICARNKAAIEAAAARFREAGAQDVVAGVLDVSDTAGCDAFVERVIDAWGGVDVLVNNAGQGINGPIESVTAEALLDHANKTQVGHYRLAKAVIPTMRAQRWGRIIEINAISGLFPGPDITSSINRAASIALTTSLAQSVAGDNILVNGLNMGWIDTGQWDRHHRELGPGVDREEFRRMVQGVIPIGRFGTGQDVANMALFLASDLADYISGASINVSGALGGQITYMPVLMAEIARKAQGQG